MSNKTELGYLYVRFRVCQIAMCNQKTSSCRNNSELSSIAVKLESKVSREYLEISDLFKQGALA